jgi:hypothetical protein
VRAQLETLGQALFCPIQMAREHDGAAAQPFREAQRTPSRRHDIILEPYGYRWYRVGGLDYLLKRTEVDAKPLVTSRPARVTILHLKKG